MARTNLREVLEAIGASPQGLTDEKDAVALLDLHLGRVQACNHTDELVDLVIVRDGARKALTATFKLRTESTLARSHAAPLVNALAPLERLIERLEKEEIQAAPKDETGAVGLLATQLSLVQACQHTDDLADLIRVDVAARRALTLTAPVRQESALARSHAEKLELALAPLERLIAKMQKDLVPKDKAPKDSTGPKPPKVVAEPVAQDAPPQPVPQVEPKVEAKAEEDPIPDHLPEPQKQVRLAMRSGKLKEQLADPEFAKATKEWVDKADPTDPEQRKDMVAVLKNMDPGNRAERQHVFEKTFKTKVQSEVRNYTVMTVADNSTKPPGRKPKVVDGKVQYFEGKPVKMALDPHAVDMMTDIMSQLPPAHMPEGWFIEGQDNPDNPSTSGSYNDETDLAQLTFSIKDVEAGGKFKYSGNCAPGDPLHDADAFDLLVRHECGHKAGITLQSQDLTSKDGGGGWVDHGNLDAALGSLSTQLNELVSKVQETNGAATELAIKNAVKTAAEGLFDPSDVAKTLKLPPDSLNGDALLKLLGQAVGRGNPAPFVLGSAPASAGDRIYIVGGPDQHWFSFSKAAWQKRVSYYQYATPEEWFAEFYAAANNKDDSIRKSAKQRYPDAWSWMQDNGCIAFPD